MNNLLQKNNIVEIKCNRVTIDWHLGNYCQFSCSYCPTELHANNSKRISLDDMKKLVTLAEEKLKFSNESKKIYFTFAGGEPTLNPNFGPFVKWLKEKNHYITLVSNGGRTLRWWNEWGEYFDQVVLSFHTEFTDLDHFYKVAEIQTKFTGVDIHLITWPNNFTVIQQAYKKLKLLKKNITIIVKRINAEWIDSPNVKFIGYTPEQNRWIDKHLIFRKNTKNIFEDNFMIREENSSNFIQTHPLIFNNYKLNNFYGWVCNLGISNLSISVNGRIWAAHCKQYQLGSFDNLDNLLWLSSESICTQYKCTCVSDVMISKSKIIKIVKE